MKPLLPRPRAWLIACGSGAVVLAAAAVLYFSQPSDRFQLRDVTAETGIRFKHTDGSSGLRRIIETVSAGLALFDYNGDGLIDVYFLNGAHFPGRPVDAAARNALYRNDGGWRFTDVTDQAGVGDTRHGLGVTVGDYDNDGYADLYLNNYGPNVLYRNNGDGTFRDASQEANVSGRDVGAGTCFLDMDADGDLDLYAANYLMLSEDDHVTTTIHGVPAYARPDRYPPAPDRLYRNNGDGTFTDASAASGVDRVTGWGMGTVCADFDGDGDTDIFVGNDVAENFLLENDGSGNFEEIGLIAGVAYDLYGNSQGSMGVDCGDYDNDGRLDFYQTSYQLQHAVLFRNLGNSIFEDVSLTSGAGDGTYALVTWGNGLVDFDNDGHRDLFIACGHLQDNVELYDDTTAYRARNILLTNTGRGKFVNISHQCGDGLSVKLSSRGVAFDDLDNDGDIDAVVLNSREKPTILRTDSVSGNHWIQIRLCGTNSNREGVGACVKVVADDLVQIAEVHSGRGYQSHWGSWLHFGLGDRAHVDRIEIHWIGGNVDVIENVAADQRLTVLEDADRVKDMGRSAEVRTR